jgi:adenylosuccinate synthase
MVVDPEHLAQEIKNIEERGIPITPEHLELSKNATFLCLGIKSRTS